VGLSINGIELKRALERYGWYVARESGHWQMAHDDRPGIVVSIPRHRDDILVRTLKGILKETNLSEDDIRRVR
jgi:predicted RNA binding protein YcfA (HicA-like mRNA interferase family)